MKKKSSSRIELYFSLTLIFVIIISTAAFFSGVKVGADKMEDKYDYLKTTPSDPEFIDSYQQQDLVNFYHTVFLPYREFKSEWVAKTDTINQTENAAQTSKLLKQLSQLADDKYSAISNTTMYTTSPLLQESQTELLSSIRLLGDAADKISSSSNLNSGEQLMKEFRNNKLYKNGINYGLTAQKKYYSSMVKWSSKVNPSISLKYDFTKDISFSSWRSYSLIIKNAAVSTILTKDSIYRAYDPQDMTARIDNLIKSGNVKSMNLHSVNDVIHLLSTTDAVKENDFKKWKNKYYSEELLPQLPFFYE